MKLSLTHTLLLVSGVLAAPLDAAVREDRSIRESLAHVTDATKDVTRFLKSHNHPGGKEGFFSEGLSRQRNLIRITREETARIARSPPLSSPEWYGLGSLTFPMGTALTDCSNAWIALRDSSGYKDQEILSVLEKTLSEGLSMADALWSKANVVNGVLTNSMRTHIATTWNNAIRAYKGSTGFTGGYNGGGYNGGGYNDGYYGPSSGDNYGPYRGGSSGDNFGPRGGDGFGGFGGNSWKGKN